MKVVLACRNHDLNNDHRFKAIKDNPFTTHLDVGLLDWDRDLVPYLSNIGLDSSKASLPQRLMLQKPINLALFLASFDSQDEEIFGRLSTTSEMLNSLLANRQAELQSKNCTWTIQQALESICDYFNAHQTLAAPQILLNQFPNAADFLQSVGLITHENGLIQLTHEAVFDHIHAQSFALAGKSVLQELISKEQFLFRRTQVRQIFAGLRDLPGQYNRYLDELRSVLTSSTMRYHVKDSVAKWLSSVERPSDAEAEIAFALSDNVSLSHLTRQIVSGTNWFDRLTKSEILLDWLTGPREHHRNFAQFLIRRAIDGCPDDAARMIDQVIEKGSVPPAQILRMLIYAQPSQKSELLLKAQIRSIGHCPDEEFVNAKFPGFADFACWHKIWPQAQARLLGAWLDRWLEVHNDGDPFDAIFGYNSSIGHWVGELSETSPEDFCLSIAPRLLIAMQRDALLDEKQAQGWRKYDRVMAPDRDDRLSDVIHFMQRAMTGLAKSTPDVVLQVMKQLLPETSTAALYLHLEAIKSNPQLLHPQLDLLLVNSNLLKAGPDGAEWLSFAESVGAVLPWLQTEARDRVWSLIRSHNPELAFIKRSLARNSIAEAESDLRSMSPDSRKWLMHNLNEVGLERWAILKTIGQAYLPSDLQIEHQQLCRKFQGRELPQAHHIMGGMVQSPIDQHAAAHMSDQQWLNAIRKYGQGCGEMRSWHRGFTVGGGHELSGVLATQVKANPERFVELAFQFPSDCLPDYLDGVLSGVIDSDADDELFLKLFRLVVPRRKELFQRGIIWGLQKRRKLITEPDVWAFLIEMAIHGNAHEDVDKAERRKDQTEKSLNDVYSGYSGLRGNAINGDRGAAYNTIADGLWENSCLLGNCLDLLNKQIPIEEFDSVRMCMLHLVNSIGKYDPDMVVCLVLKISEKSLIPLSDNYGVHVLRWLLPNRFEKTWPVVRIMIVSQDETISAVGGLILGIAAFHHTEAKDHFEKLREKSPLTRRISADIAASNIRRGDNCDMQRQWLLIAMNDDVVEIQKEVCSANWGEILAADSRHHDLAQAFVDSPAFLQSSDSFIHAFEDIADAHPDLGLNVVDRLIQIAPDYHFQDRNGHHTAMHSLGPILNRMYQNTENNPQAASHILDRIDALLKVSFYGIDDVLKSHERV